MADNFDIYKRCTKCGGNGKLIINDSIYDEGPPQEIDCPLCNGEGKTLWGEAHEQDID